MDQKTCWNCGNLIDSRCAICPACNAPQELPHPAPEKQSIALFINSMSYKTKMRLISLALAILGVVLASISKSSFFSASGGAFVIAAVVVFVYSGKQQKAAPQIKYVGCLSSSTFHRPNCRSVKLMTRENRVDYDPSITYSRLISIGMKPCTKCKPR